MIWLRHSLRWLIYLPLGVLLLAAILVSTEFGTRMLLGVTSSLVPGIEIEYRSGRLNGQIQINHFHLDLDFLTIDASDADIHWNPWCTVTKQLCIKAADIADFTLVLDTDFDEPELNEQDDAPYQLDLPFAMALEQVAVDNGEVIVDDIIIRWQNGSASAHLADDLIDVTVAHFASGLVHVDSTTSASDNTEQLESTDAPWSLAHLADTRLPLRLLVSNASADNFTFAYQDWLQESFSDIAINGSWQYVTVNLKQVDVTHAPYGQVTVAGVSELSHPYPSQLDVTIEPMQLPGFSALANSHWQATLDGDLNNFVLAATEQQQLFWQIHGDIVLADADLPFNLVVAGQQMIWPDEVDQLITYQALNASATGNRFRQDFQLTGEFSAAVGEQPMQANIDVTGHHGNRSLVVSNLALSEQNSGGVFKGAGQLDYGQPGHGRHDQSSSTSTGASTAFRWQVDAEFEQLQLPFRDLLASPIISGSVKHSGSYLSADQAPTLEPSWQLQFSDTQINGEFLDLPVTVSGDVLITDKLQGHANNLLVQLAGSQLQLNGHVDDNWQLTGTIQGRNLSQWLAGVSGQLDGRFDITGPYLQPTVALTGAMNRGGYDDLLQFESASLHGQYQPFDDHQHQLELTLHDVELEHLPSDFITLTSSGNLADHQLMLTSTGEFAPVVQLNGQWHPQQQNWQGQLQQAQFDTNAGHWQLDKKVQLLLSLQQEQLSVSAHCWFARESQLCLQQDAVLGKTGNAKVNLNISGQDLTRQLVHEDYKVTGQLIGELDANWQDGQSANAQLNLHSDNIQMSFHNPLDDLQQTVAINSLDVAGKLTAEQTNFELALVAQHGSEIRFNGSLDHQTDEITAALNLENIELGHFKSLLPDIERVQGALNGRAQVSGYIEQPQIHGDFQLSGGAVLLLSNPTPIDRLTAQMTLTGNSAELNSELYLGENAARLTALADWHNGFVLESRLQGEQLNVLLPPESDFKLSPDLHFKMTNGQPVLTGHIDVPAANIIFRRLPDSGIALSDDQVFIDQADAQATTATNLTAKVDISLADNIRVDAVGFNGRIGGQLEVRKQPNLPVQLYGPIQLTSGRYRAYGQRLEIQSDSVVHFNGPADLASLNIRAAREIKSADVIAGIHASGTIGQPTIEFYSDPAMEQQEVLSYIIRGRGLDSDDSNSSMAAAAAVGVSAAESMGITNSMEQMTGFQQVALDTEGEGDETQVTISGYVGERLYLKYGMGVFEPINEVTVRFYLLNQLWLETVSGIERSADLYYSFFID